MANTIDRRKTGRRYQRRLTDEEVVEIRAATGMGCVTRMAEKFGLSPAAITRIRKFDLYRETTAALSEQHRQGFEE